MKSKFRVHFFLLTTSITLTTVGGTLRNQMVCGQTITPSRSVINSLDKRSKVNKLKCPLTSTKPCRERPRNPSNNINITNPYKGYLLNNKPLLSWSNIPGAKEYIVRLQQVEQAPIWERKTTRIELPYPDNEPLLEVDKDYKLIVEALVNDERKTGSITLRVLPEKERIDLVTEEKKIKQPGLKPEEITIKLAELYRKKELYTDAIPILKDAILKKEKAGLPFSLLLGDLYLDVDQYDLAENSYQQALTLANLTKNDKGKADAQFGLGLANDKQNNPLLAVKWLREAHSSYVNLGVGEQENTIITARYLGEIYKEIGNKKEAIAWFQRARDGYKKLGQIEGRNYTEVQNYIEGELRNLK